MVPASNTDNNEDDDEEAVPMTSLPCRWKAPKKRKESNKRISGATFEKYDYTKPNNFDPRPQEHYPVGCLSF